MSGQVEPTKGVDWRRLQPKYWHQNYPTDRAWDAILNRLLDEHIPVSLGQHYCQVGPVKVWVENWPYAYARPEHPPLNNSAVPMVRTRLRLRKALYEATYRDFFA